ncbi:hypothetical protein C7441_1104 [Pseudaminobacter salicylatoxidans]|uniref:Uncharacterized protein n=1 Tax=Pseudaminobacter salicylatoxidans TaxID=93369 RepID=A0A316C0D4_PSESE|nr:hypothetical protein [Pseudaminobacter salicylatoxidans]PWJ81473.1 hypothetical protein C7441_1104 [Pseudaminobacter salicylatoxidans]
MNEKKPFRTINYARTVPNLEAINLISLHALRTVIEEMVEQRGGIGPWYDELEQELIRDAKGTIAEGVPIETEAGALKLGIDVLQMTLDVVRHKFGSAE